MTRSAVRATPYPLLDRRVLFVVSTINYASRATLSIAGSPRK